MRIPQYLFLGVVALLIRPTNTTAQPEGPVEATVIGIASLDLGTLLDSPVFADARTTLQTKAKRFEQMALKNFGLKPESIQRMTMVMFKCTGPNYETMSPAYVLTARQPVDAKAFEKATGSKCVIEKGKYDGLPDVAVYETETQRVAIAGKSLVLLEVMNTLELKGDMYVTVRKPIPGEAEILAKAFKRDEDRAVILAKDKAVFSLSMEITEVARLFQGIPSEFTGEAQPLPAPLGDIATAKFVLGSITLAGTAHLKFEFSYASTEAAQAGKAALDTARTQLHRLLEKELARTGTKKSTGVMAELGTFALGLLEGVALTHTEKTVTATTSVDLTKDLANALVKGVLAAEQAATRTLSQNNLKQIALAAHNFHDANATGLLQNICDAKGKPLLSWRVNLLPYLEQEELYKQFKLDEPWDSEHNKPLIAKMPKVFEVPTAVAAKEGHTFYQAFVGKKGQAARPLLQDEGEPLKISGITDGTSNTIMVAEAADAVAWTRPDDLPFDAEGKLPKLGGHFDDGFNIALCDGSVRFIRCGATIEGNWETILKALITANGGETAGLEDD